MRTSFQMVFIYYIFFKHYLNFFFHITGGVRTKLDFNSRPRCLGPTWTVSDRGESPNCWRRKDLSPGLTPPRRGTAYFYNTSSATGSGLAIWQTWNELKSIRPAQLMTVPRPSWRLDFLCHMCLKNTFFILNSLKATKGCNYVFPQVDKSWSIL